MSTHGNGNSPDLIDFTFGEFGASGAGAHEAGVGLGVGEAEGVPQFVGEHTGQRGFAAVGNFSKFWPGA